MILDSHILFLDPSSYVPFDDFDGGLPLDIINDTSLSALGTIEYTSMSDIIGDSVSLYEGASLSLFFPGIASGGSISHSVWFSLIDEEADIFSFPTEGGLARVYTDSSRNLYFDHNDDPMIVENIPLDTPHLITITRNGSNGAFEFWLNDQSVLSGTMSQVDEGTITLGGNGSVSLAHYFNVLRVLPEIIIMDNYYMGTEGFGKLRIDSGSFINIGYKKFRYLSTDWQTTGTISVKY